METQSKNFFQHKKLIKNHMILIAVENAKKLGWFVEKKTKKVLILKKNIDQLSSRDKNTEELIDHILNFQIR
jgi:hypothetical protein